jgi:tetratricopeptide (TPR) repeat protein
MSSTSEPHPPRQPDPQPDPWATREDCPSPELLAAYAEGHRLLSERYRLESHFAECDRCLTLLVEVTAFRAEHPQKDDATSREGSPRGTTEGLFGMLRRPPRMLWAASGTVALAASLLVAFLIQEPSQSDLDAMIAAIGDQRVTEARLVGFQHGRRPDVFRSTDPTTTAPALTTQTHATVAEVQERAAAAAASTGTATPTVMHTLGMSQLMTGDLDAAIQSLERAGTIDAPNAGFLSDLAAAYLTRGIRQNARQDFELALAAANRAAELDRTFPPALFNRALALEKLDQRDRARDAWADYLKLDDRSPWADEARERVKP